MPKKLFKDKNEFFEFINQTRVDDIDAVYQEHHVQIYLYMFDPVFLVSNSGVNEGKCAKLIVNFLQQYPDHQRRFVTPIYHLLTHAPPEAALMLTGELRGLLSPVLNVLSLSRLPQERTRLYFSNVIYHDMNLSHPDFATLIRLMDDSEVHRMLDQLEDRWSTLGRMSIDALVDLIERRPQLRERLLHLHDTNYYVEMIHNVRDLISSMEIIATLEQRVAVLTAVLPNIRFNASYPECLRLLELCNSEVAQRVILNPENPSIATLSIQDLTFLLSRNDISRAIRREFIARHPTMMDNLANRGLFNAFTGGLVEFCHWIGTLPLEQQRRIVRATYFQSYLSNERELALVYSLLTGTGVHHPGDMNLNVLNHFFSEAGFPSKLRQLDGMIQNLDARGERSAADAADRLYWGLNRLFQAYKNDLSNNGYAVFLTQSSALLNVAAEGLLSKQRGWKCFLANLGLAIAGLGVVYLAAATIHYLKTDRFLFFTKTKSVEQIESIKKSILMHTR